MCRRCVLPAPNVPTCTIGSPCTCEGHGVATLSGFADFLFQGDEYLCSFIKQDLADLAPIDQTLEKEHHERTKVKNIQVIELGRYEVRAWPPAFCMSPLAACSVKGSSTRCAPCLLCCSHTFAHKLISTLELCLGTALPGRL